MASPYKSLDLTKKTWKSSQLSVESESTSTSSYVVSSRGKVFHSPTGYNSDFSSVTSANTSDKADHVGPSQESLDDGLPVGLEAVDLSGQNLPRRPGGHKKQHTWSLSDSLSATTGTEPIDSAETKISLWQINGPISRIFDPSNNKDDKTDDCSDSVRDDKPVSLLTNDDMCEPSPSRVRKGFRKLIERRGRPKSARDFVWSIKRNRLNKAIYEHKEHKCIQCTDKIELEVAPDSGTTFKLKLTLSLYPYGVDSDKGKYVTLRVDIDSPKRAPKLSDNAFVRITATFFDPNNSTTNRTSQKNIKIFIRESYIYRFVSHRLLRESKSETVELKWNAKFHNNPHSYTGRCTPI